MISKDLTNWQAVGIGCLVATGASIVVFLMPLTVSFWPFLMKFINSVFPLSIVGAVAGKYISKTWIGSLLGAVIVVIIEFVLIFSIASMRHLD